MYRALPLHTLLRPYLHILLRLPLELVFDGAGRCGELQGEGHRAGLGVDVQLLDKPAADNVLAEVRVDDAAQLLQDLVCQAGRLGAGWVGGGRGWVSGMGVVRVVRRRWGNESQWCSGASAAGRNDGKQQIDCTQMVFFILLLCATAGLGAW
jgi:hypothetical protein